MWGAINLRGWSINMMGQSHRGGLGPQRNARGMFVAALPLCVGDVLTPTTAIR